MLTVYEQFSDAVTDSEEVNLFREQILDGEILILPAPSEGIPAPGAVLISDISTRLTDWSNAGGFVIGYEHDGIRLPAKEILTDIGELYPEDLADIVDYVTKTRHYMFPADRFDFYRPGFDDYKAFYTRQLEEPYLLPDSLRNLSDSDLMKRYDNDMELSRMNRILSVLFFTEYDSDKLIGQVSLELSELTDKAYNLSYYILPEYRGKGLGTKAVMAFVERLRPRLSGMPVLAIIDKRNKPSVSLARACGFTLLPADSKLLEKRPEGFFTMVYEDGTDA
jgi:RimJ/RimL family protein N-acetyltransferase